MRVLIYEPAFRRIEAQLAQASSVEPLVMSGEGAITLRGLSIAAEDARPDAGWASSDVFAGPSRAFMVTLLKAPALRWVQSGAAGFDDPVFARFVSKGARLTTSDAQSIPIAEYVLSSVLDHYQRGPERRAAQAGRRWEPLPFREVAGGVWLIVGFGSIGQAVAQRARAFGATVIGIRRRVEPHPLADHVVAPNALREVLPRADVVVLCAPLTTATANLADAVFFLGMKPGSVLVNVGRGGLVDELALLAALDRGAPEKAILDVFRQEPLETESPFWSHPRVSVSPHGSAVGSGRVARNDALFLENLDRFRRNEPLRNEAQAHQVLGEAAPETR